MTAYNGPCWNWKGKMFTFDAWTETPCGCYAHTVYCFITLPCPDHVMWLCNASWCMSCDLSNCDLTLAISDRWIVFHVHHEDVEEVPFGGRVPPVQPVAGKCPGFKISSACKKHKHFVAYIIITEITSACQHKHTLPVIFSLESLLIPLCIACSNHQNNLSKWNSHCTKKTLSGNKDSTNLHPP